MLKTALCELFLAPKIKRDLSTLRPIYIKRLHKAAVSKLGSLLAPETMDSDSDSSFSEGPGGIFNCKDYPADHYFDAPKLFRRQSTFDDEQKNTVLLEDILDYQSRNVSSWIVENKVKALCMNYKSLLTPHREGFIKVLATRHAVNQEKIDRALNNLKEFESGSVEQVKALEQLKTVLAPQYSWLFKIIGRLENGVKFLVDLRTDVQELMGKTPPGDAVYVHLQQLNNSLRELLSLWFSVGFLNLERVTWKSPCEMLQKISEYEAVHPVRSWAELKRRVGVYRRCFVFTHHSMPGEPLVVLHTALAPHIPTSIRDIVTSQHRMSVDASSMHGMTDTQGDVEEPSLVKAAVFYSISSTQPGLQGIELGNYLIKRVVTEIQAEFPKASEFSTLSPIPLFRNWLFDKLKAAEKGEVARVMQADDWKGALEKTGGWGELRRVLASNTWHSEPDTVSLLRAPLTQACAHYLYLEKRRAAAFDPVANFHLRNGAVMWRLNWLADTSPRGMNTSLSLMVNYRYYLAELEENSRRYLEAHIINASEQILTLAGQGIASKM